VKGKPEDCGSEPNPQIAGRTANHQCTYYKLMFLNVKPHPATLCGRGNNDQRNQYGQQCHGYKNFKLNARSSFQAMGNNKSDELL
jgi:hypothetical protein